MRSASTLSLIKFLMKSSCEYRDGCEWREQKALEVLSNLEAKVATIQSPIGIL